MRAIFVSFLIALIGVPSAGCGSVKAKPDAGEGSDVEDAAMPDALGCVANSYSCGSDNALYQCDAEGVASTKVQDCQFGCSGDHCNECDANSTFCSSDDLVMCDANGTIVNPQTCEFGCQMDRCNTCEPSVAYCDNGNAVSCGADGMPGATMACGAPGCSGGVCNSCQPNTTTCQGDKLVVCNGSGTVQSATSCALGCATSPSAHCKALVPSYGVPAPSGSLPNLLVDANATLNISNCSASPSSVDLTIDGTTMSLIGSPQVLVKNQSGGPPICIVRFGTITVQSGFTLSVVNSASLGHVLSLQAVGDIQLAGTVTFTNAADGPSPGFNASAQGVNGNNKTMAPGAGGAGAARAGGKGGTCIDCNGATDYGGSAGGAAVTTSTMLLNGGSVGGSVVSGSTVAASGGLGGGGLQLVSLNRVTLAATGRIILNGQGGTGPNLNSNSQTAGGGGSGGTLVVEAPQVSISANAIVVANGAGGAGGCWERIDLGGGFYIFRHMNGESGQLSTVRAAGGDCPGYGDGGFEANGSTNPSINGSDSDSGCATADGGGGGGANGFIYLRARTASAVMVDGATIVSPQASIGAVTAN